MRCVVWWSAQEQHCSTFLHQSIEVQQDLHTASTASDAGDPLHTGGAKARK